MERKTAAEIRSLAWAALGRNDGWVVAIVVVLALMTGTALITLPLQIGQGIGEKLLEIADASEDGADVAMAGIGLLLFLPCLLCKLVADLYLSGFAQFGYATMSLDVLRERGKWNAIYAGWGIGWRTAWLYMLAGLLVLLWFLIPVAGWFWFGPRALYTYRLVMLLRVDHRDWSAQQCLKESKRLMEGNRWRLFCFDLSYLGWWLLGICTCCIGLIAVIPYTFVGLAAFYQTLLEEDEARNVGD